MDNGLSVLPDFYQAIQPVVKVFLCQGLRVDTLSLFGEVAVAYIIPREGEAIDPQEIVDHCVGEIANFKVPRYVEIVDELPMTQSGKVQKFKLRDIAQEALRASRMTKLAPMKK